MEALETDHKRIETLSQKNANANLAFANYLTTLNPEMVEERIKQVAAEVTAAVDCTACAKCCKALIIAPDYADVSLLASSQCASNGEPMTTGEFKKKYMRVDFEGDLVFKQRPCPFLKNSRCSVYEVRPKLCRKYPYLDQGGVLKDLNRVLRNVSVCPIVFNTFERLKDEFI